MKRIEKSKRLGASAVWMILMGLGFLTVLPVVAESRLKKSQTLEGESAPHLPSPADETPLETALSIDLVDIDTDFSGADLLLFGSVQADTDIVVVIQGPPADVTVRRKHRQAGIWINAEEREYDNIPAYYHVASNRSMTAFVSAQDRHHLGLDLAALRADPNDIHGSQNSGFEASGSGKPVKADSDFSRGLIEDMKERGFYGQSENGVTFVGSRLFRMDLRLPPNVPVGTFAITIYAFRNGVLQDMSSADFSVGKIGIGAALYSFAHHHPFLYGIAAVVMAVGLGSLSAAVFRTL